MIGKVYLPISTGEAWAPPSDWQDISQTATNEIKLLVADTNLTYAFKCTTSSGTYSINWGDGTTTSGIASNTQAQYTYTRGTGVACSRGYTTFVISIKPDTGNLTMFQVAKHTLLTVNQHHDILYANIKNAIYLTTAANMFYVSNGAFCARLESVIMPTSWGSITSCMGMFSRCYSLKSITLPTSWGSVDSIYQMFNYCFSLQQITMPTSWGSLNYANQVFYNCGSLQQITMPTSWGNVSEVFGMFQNCSSLQKIILPTSWGNVNNTSSMFATCNSLQQITMPTSLGNITNCSQMFQNCYSLQYNAGMQYLGSDTNQCNFTNAFTSTQNIDDTLSFNSRMSKFTYAGTSGNINHITGIRLTNANSTFAGTSPQVDVAYNNMDANAIKALFGDLPTLSGKTIRITGCPGAADTSNDSIATSKGWTINRTT